MNPNLYRKGKGSYSTSELNDILEVFEEVWGSSFRDRVHAVPAYPCSSENYKKPCNLINIGKSFLASPKWAGIYPRIAVTVSKIRSIKDDQFLIGLFDSQIVTIDIDSIYDYDSKISLDMSDTSEREYIRNYLIEEFQKMSPRFIIEDSSKGFHVMYWCKSNEYFSYRHKYQIIGTKYVVKFDLISCRSVKSKTTDKNGSVIEKNRMSGGYTLLGYGKQIPSYTVRYIGNAHSLSRIPYQFTNQKLFYNTLEHALKDLDYQNSLKDLDYREKVKKEIFYDWFLEKSRSRKEEIALEKMVDRYIAAVKKNEELDNDKGFIKKNGKNVDFKKLSPNTSIIKVDAVKRSTIESVYKFYAYLNTLPIGTSYTRETALDEFISFCLKNDFELRGLWNHIDGKLLFTNRFYKVLSNLSTKDPESKLTVSAGNFIIEEHSQTEEEPVDEEDSIMEELPVPIIDTPNSTVIEYNYSQSYEYASPTGFSIDNLIDSFSNPP